MLTVIREASAVAVETAERSNDLEAVLAATTHAAARALDKTPSLLPVLREAGVVDAGGAGLLRLFEGALAYAPRRGRRCRPRCARRAIPSPTPAELVHVETGHGYETVYLIHPFPGQLLDLDRIRAYLRADGRVGERGRRSRGGQDPRPQRPSRPRPALRPCSWAAIVNATIMDLDHQSRRGPRRASRPPAPAAAGVPGAVRRRPRPPAIRRPSARLPRVPLGVVAVAPGDGLAEALAAFGVADERLHVTIVRGGQAENPSAGRDPGGHRRLAGRGGHHPAQQPERQARRRPGRRDGRPAGAGRADPERRRGDRRPPRGRPRRSARAATPSRCSRPGRALQTLLVTEAVRDAVVVGPQGEAGPDDGPRPRRRAARRGRRPRAGRPRRARRPRARLQPGDALVRRRRRPRRGGAPGPRRIHEAWPAIEEVEVRHGGQPHYRYLVSAE